MSLPRRHFLRAAGGLGVPLFLRQALAASPTLPPRLCILMQANGTHQPAFWPTTALGSSPILEPILGDAALRSKTIVVKGILNNQMGFGNEHDRGWNSLWTGVAPVGTPENGFGGAASVDQMIKQALRPAVPFQSLNCGVLAADVGPKSGHRTSFSYAGPHRQIPTQIDPYRLFAALLGPVVERSTRDATEVAERARRRLRLRRSVLDVVAADLKALEGRVGGAERDKLALHTQALREYEQRLGATLGAATASDTPGACGRMPPRPGLDPRREDDVPGLLDSMIDLVGLALACNLTRIVTFPIGHSGNNWRYRWLGIDKDGHEELAHKDTADGSDVPVARDMTAISTWGAKAVARLARLLEGTPDGAGTALDNSLVVWANENGTGYHSLANLPVVLLGRAGGRLAARGLVYHDDQSHRRLGTTVLNFMGVEASGLGLEPRCGTLVGVE
jgi:hypothetical protein